MTDSDTRASWRTLCRAHRRRGDRHVSARARERGGVREIVIELRGPDPDDRGRCTFMSPAEAADMAGVIAQALRIVEWTPDPDEPADDSREILRLASGTCELVVAVSARRRRATIAVECRGVVVAAVGVPADLVGQVSDAVVDAADALESEAL